jgi:pyruvate ferredoxin oxidoreductase gamma subunit
VIEVRFHGRGGQGAVTSAELVALAAISEEKYAQSFPSFRPEQRGAPVQSSTRVSDEPIRLRSGIQEPDLVVVLDPSLIEVGGALNGLKPDGIIVINTRKSLADIKKQFSIKNRTAIVNATSIAQEILGLPITNTTMIGALVKASGIVNMESLLEPLRHRFGKIAERNITVCQKAFDETVVEE